MKLPTISGVHPVRCEVIELLEKDGVRIATLALKYWQIEVPMEVLGDVHLGDRVLIVADVVLKEIRTGNC